VFSAASYVGDAGGHKSVIAVAGGPFCLGRRRPAGNVASGVPDPRSKGEVIATEFVVRGRREGGAPGTRCMSGQSAPPPPPTGVCDCAEDGRDGRDERRGGPLGASQVRHLLAPPAALCPRARRPVLVACNGGRAKPRLPRRCTMVMPHDMLPSWIVGAGRARRPR
jgi:hypothetical protein